jgi:DNA (cytosine-5)-methyltransferase 1
MGMPKTFIDLFAGIGGFHWALKELKYECLLAVEKDEAAQKIYKHNFPECTEKMVGDIRKLTRVKPRLPKTERTAEEIKKHLSDIYGIKAPIGFICGGFPCQPFSKSGKQRGSKDKTRGTLFGDIMLLADALRPQFIILENVRNLASDKHKPTIQTICDELERLDYEVNRKPIILSPHNLPPPYGQPQVRERVFILARSSNTPKSKSPEMVFEHCMDVRAKNKNRPWDAKAILLETNETAAGYDIEHEDKWLKAWDEFTKIIPGKLPGHPIWTEVFGKSIRTKGMPKWKKNFIIKNQQFFDKNREIIVDWMDRHGVRTNLFPLSRRKFEWQASTVHPTQKGRTIQDLLIQLRPSGIRVKPPTHLPALVAINQTTIMGPMLLGRDYGKYRRITPKEAAILQGMRDVDFDDQSDGLCYKQLGNAVNVGVIKYLVERLTGAVPCETP